MTGVEHESYLHEDKCKFCGSYVGHKQDCSEYDKAEGHVDGAETDKYIYEKQVEEITATLRETMSAPELVTNEEAGVDKLDKPTIESIGEINARIKACEEVIESLSQYAHSIENQPDLIKKLKTINRKAGEVKELYFGVIQSTDIDLIKLKQLSEEATKLQFLINEFKREFSGQLVEPATVLERKDDSESEKVVESKLNEIEVLLSEIEKYIKGNYDTDATMEESYESLNNSFSTMRDAFTAYKQGSDQASVQNIHLHVESLLGVTKILRKKCEPKF